MNLANTDHVKNTLHNRLFDITTEAYRTPSIYKSETLHKLILLTLPAF